MKDVNRFNKVIEKVKAARTRQEELWGTSYRDNATMLAVLMEEVGEVATGYQITEIEHEPDDNMREELVHVAAVAIRWLESFEDSSFCFDCKKLLADGNHDNCLPF